MIIKLLISTTHCLLLLCTVFSMLGCDSISDANHAPEIHEMFLDSPVVTPGRLVYITVVATDKDGDEIQYAWSCSAGTILVDSGSSHRYDLTSNPCRWAAPDTAGEFVITCVVSDGMDTSSKSITITVT